MWRYYPKLWCGLHFNSLSIVNRVCGCINILFFNISVIKDTLLYFIKIFTNASIFFNYILSNRFFCHGLLGCFFFMSFFFYFFIYIFLKNEMFVSALNEFPYSSKIEYVNRSYFVKMPSLKKNWYFFYASKKFHEYFCLFSHSSKLTFKCNQSYEWYLMFFLNLFIFFKNCFFLSK